MVSAVPTASTATSTNAVATASTRTIERWYAGPGVGGRLGGPPRPAPDLWLGPPLVARGLSVTPSAFPGLGPGVRPRPSRGSPSAHSGPPGPGRSAGAG